MARKPTSSSDGISLTVCYPACSGSTAVHARTPRAVSSSGGVSSGHFCPQWVSERGSRSSSLGVKRSRAARALTVGSAITLSHGRGHRDQRLPKSCPLPLPLHPERGSGSNPGKKREATGPAGPLPDSTGSPGRGLEGAVPKHLAYLEKSGRARKSVPRVAGLGKGQGWGGG